MSVLYLWPFKTSIWLKLSSPNLTFFVFFLIFFLIQVAGGTQKEFLMKRGCHHILQELPVKSHHPFPRPHKKNERTLNERVWKGLTENWKIVNNWQLTNRLKFDWQLTFALDFTVNWQRAWLSFNYFLQTLFLRPFIAWFQSFRQTRWSNVRLC